MANKMDEKRLYVAVDISNSRNNYGIGFRTSNYVSLDTLYGHSQKKVEFWLLWPIKWPKNGYKWLKIYRIVETITELDSGH